jgi:hypothetical protein
MERIKPVTAPGVAVCRHHCTSEHQFSSDEVEFLAAIEEFKKTSGKKFPTWTDTLKVILSLGYLKMDRATPAHSDVPEPFHEDELVDLYGEIPSSWFDLPTGLAGA